VVWRIKYADAEGRQVMETVGAERDGWTRRKAEAELRERLVKVERKNWRRPKPTTLADYAPSWLERRTVRSALKDRSVESYELALNRLTAKLGALPLGTIRVRHLHEYIREQLEAGYDPSTVNLRPLHPGNDLQDRERGGEDGGQPRRVR
jgi:hypothetical protein